MRERITQIIAILLLATVTATSYWYSQSIRRTTRMVPPAGGTPDFSGERLVMTQFDEQGRAKYKLFADTLVHFADDDEIELLNPRLLSLRPDRPQIEARALHAEVDDAGEEVRMDGGVVVTRAATAAAPALQLTTESLRALPDSDRYQSLAPVVVERGNVTISADRMDLDNIARTVVFDGHTRTRWAPPPANLD